MLHAEARLQGRLSAAAPVSTRYSFTAQFLRGAAIFARRADELEDEGASISDDAKSEYRACIVGAVTQATAALEAEISEVTNYGPGHHLGSNGLDAAARDFLAPLAEIIDREQTVRRYDLVLHLLRKPPFDKGAQPYQDASLLVRLRNELIHYKSKWGEQMDQERLFASLEQLRFDKPSFMPLGSTNFFPHRCLSTSLASWSVTTSANFIDTFYSRLSIASPLTAHSAHLTVPPIRFATRS